MKKIRVLYVLDCLNYKSGVSSIILNYYRSIDKSVISIDFMVHEKVTSDLENELFKNGSKLYTMPELRIKNYFIYKRKLCQFFKNHKEYSIIHGHIPNVAFFYLGEAKKNGIPIRIIHSHNSKGADTFCKKIRNRLLFYIGIQKANKYFACGKKAADFLYGKNTKKDVFIMPNAISYDSFRFNKEKRNKIRRLLNIENMFVIGHIGRFCKQKNHNFLIKIFYEIQKKESNTKLLLLGDGDLKEKISKKAKDYNIFDKIIFTGIVDNTSDYLQAMDVFVLPSIFEGVPVAAIEAQVAGLPCVFSDRITKEIDTKYTTYLSLNDTVSVWTDTIIKQRQYERNNYALHGYDIRKESQRITMQYKKYLEEFKNQ